METILYITQNRYKNLQDFTLLYDSFTNKI